MKRRRGDGDEEMKRRRGDEREGKKGEDKSKIYIQQLSSR
jgi:hypothetical protein